MTHLLFLGVMFPWFTRLETIKFPKHHLGHNVSTYILNFHKVSTYIFFPQSPENIVMMLSLISLNALILSKSLRNIISRNIQFLAIHPAGRALTSDWFANSFVIVVHEKIFFDFSQNFLSSFRI